MPGQCAFNPGPLGKNVSESHQARLTYDDNEMLRAAVGMYYFHARDVISSNFGTAPPLTAVPTRPLPIVSTNFLLFLFLSNNLVKDDVYSPFGEVNLSLLDKRLRLGAEIQIGRAHV